MGKSTICFAGWWWEYPTRTDDFLTEMPIDVGFLPVWRPSSGSGQEAFRLRHNQQLPAWEPKTTARALDSKEHVVFLWENQHWDHIWLVVQQPSWKILVNDYPIYEMEKNVWHHQPDMISWRRDWELQDKGLKMISATTWDLTTDEVWQVYPQMAPWPTLKTTMETGLELLCPTTKNRVCCLPFFVFVGSDFEGPGTIQTKWMSNSKTWNMELHCITVITYNRYININSANMSITILGGFLKWGYTQFSSI